jgi:hypothetical protein
MENFHVKKPYCQGELDGMCAVYSIVNATKIISNTTDEQCRILFKSIISFLDQKHNLANLLVDGMYINIIGSIFSEVIGDLIHNRSMPFLRVSDITLDTFWAEMMNFLTESKRVILLGLEGCKDHWTLVESMTDKQINLFDSSRMKKLYRSRCSITKATTRRPYRVVPNMTYFLS